MSQLLNRLKKTRGQAMTEYVLIVAFIGLVLSVAAFDLFEGTKGNYYQGMLPLSKGAEIPPRPDGTGETNTKKKPQAIIKGPSVAYIGQEITLTDESVDPDGRIASTSWGSKTIKRTFNEEGTFVINLTVVDNDGLRDSVSFTVSVGNDLPVAIIKTTPENTMPAGLDLKVDGSQSTDPEGDQLESWEWYLTTPTTERTRMDWPLEGATLKSSELTSGKYTFELKVMDSAEAWSSITTKTVEVINRKPNAVITMTPNTAIDTETKIVWGHEKSNDPDGDAIAEAEWDNKKETYPAGTHTVQLRVKDASGMWSDWTRTTFTVSAYVPLVQKFNYTGSVQTFTVPTTGNYRLELWGAQGGRIGSDDSTGGRGAYVKGTYNVTKGTVLYLYVGGKGGDSGTSIDGYNSLNNNGGWNGGGNGSGSRGPGGGGATDVRTTNNTTYANRLLVAGGGGGGFTSTNDVHAGYTTNIISGAIGQNGGTSWHGTNNNWPSDNAGGGGGYSGGRTVYGDDPSRGYGGSSYIGPGLSDAQAIAGDGMMPSPNSGNIEGNQGNGAIVITRMP